MKINDQKHRIGNASTNDIALRKNIDRHNFYVLDSIVNVHGSLGIKELGRSGFSAFMLLVQHQDQNLSFQLKVLKSLSSELSKGNIIESRYAMLLDRVNLATSKVQIFGTQLVYFTDQDDIMYAIPELLYNNKNLTVLRDYFGLPHINRYINDMNEYVRKNKTK